ncbi:pyrimidine/purine nucleoside phosphorylase [Thiomonas sp.]|jgi:uncharacterized protein YaiE (UPF0345 family)|uniref:pyrimidine/purine nucleoside phosphorylase n=1 Tax=Thiomonas sp. TaxID=2047785 RepID=UPI002614F1D3|nr:pyrimidine/purine nucleoside phosphorylase [Thiomonas sp.]
MSPGALRGAVVPRANVYFDGRCVSHTVQLDDGSRKSVGVILPGSTLLFNTGAPEVMQGAGGWCEWRMQGGQDWKRSAEGEEFSVPGNAHFEIRTGDEAYHYVCHFG